MPRWYRYLGTEYCEPAFLEIEIQLFNRMCTIVQEYQPKLQRRSLFMSVDYIFDFMLKKYVKLSIVYRVQARANHCFL